ncbi:MAG: NADH-quinone oxidoreductase subunit A [Alphaproteobacteria bacterium]|nr:NADH-quinone oxidoreductase subunit A [Alphaproteobacteria bacterium]
MFNIIPSYVQEYLPIVIFFAVATVVSLVVMGIPFICAENKPDKDKLSPYECGFQEFGDSRSRFDVRFYLVAILFIIFDIEVIFLFPWALVLKSIGVYGFVSMMLFLFILIVGFIYEWKKGALEWE